jgi:hypothetical protein
MPRGLVVPQVTETSVNYTVTYLASAGTPISPTTSYFVFAGNSVFNPDLNASLENYPIGHFQWAFLYQRFQVISSAIEVRAHSTSTIPLGSCKFVIYPKPYSAAIPGSATTVDHFAGEPLAGRLRHVGPVSGTSVIAPERMAKTTAFMLSRPENQLFCNEAVSGYNTLNTFQPASQWFWLIVVEDDASPLSTGPDVQFTFSITYRVRYYQPHGLTVHSREDSGSGAQNTTDQPPCDCAEAEETKD